MRVNETPYYHIPGGHIEIGEDSKQAIIREIKEKKMELKRMLLEQLSLMRMEKF